MVDEKGNVLCRDQIWQKDEVSGRQVLKYCSEMGDLYKKCQGCRRQK